MRVLVATDGGDDVTGIVKAAVSLYGADAHYLVLSVSAPLPLTAMSPLGVTPTLLLVAGDTDSPVGDPMGAAEARSKAAADLLPSDAIVEMIADVGGPGPTICDTAAERDVDVIVIGHHERGWLSRLVQPSVGAYVIDHAPCPVTVVGADDV